MRGPPVRLRDLTVDEASAVETLARSRMAPARRVERARIIWRASQGETPPAIAAALGFSAETVRGRGASIIWGRPIACPGLVDLADA